MRIVISLYPHLLRRPRPLKPAPLGATPFANAPSHLRLGKTARRHLHDEAAVQARREMHAVFAFPEPPAHMLALVSRLISVMAERPMCDIDLQFAVDDGIVGRGEDVNYHCVSAMAAKVPANTARGIATSHNGNG